MRSLYPVLEHGHLLQRRNSTVVSMWSEREKAMHSNGAFPPDISWVDDANWFEEEVRRYIALAPALNVTRPATRYEKPQEWQIQGCCPAAVAMWPERHGHRCCSEKWHRLLPVQAVGGVNLDMLSSTTASGRTVVFLADSMGEQQLVALLCQAWISPGFKFEMLNCDGQPSFDSSNVSARPQIDDFASACAAASIIMSTVIDGGQRGSTSRNATEPSSNRARVMFATITRRHSTQHGREWRLNLLSIHFAAMESLYSVAGVQDPTYAPGHKSARIPVLDQSWDSLMARSVALVFNCWQHGLPHRTTFSSMLAHIVRRWPDAKMILSEALHNHFPGGNYRMVGQYPPASCPVLSPRLRWDYAVMHPCVCDQWVQGVEAAHALEPDNFKPSANGLNNTMITTFNTWLNQLSTTHNSLNMAGKSSPLLVSRVRVVRLTNLFQGRGDAHTEWAWNNFQLGRGARGHISQRDCLHLCIAPGVSDAVALATTTAIAS